LVSDHPSIALGHDAAVVKDDHRLRAATRPDLGLGEGAIEGGAQLRVGRLDHRRARDVGRASGRRAAAGDGHVGHRGIYESAPDAVGMDGPTLEPAGQARRHGPLGAIHVVAQDPKEVTDGRHGRKRLGKGLRRVQAGDEGLRAERVADQAGGHARRLARTEDDHGGDEAHQQKTENDEENPAHASSRALYPRATVPFCSKLS
jgi:hypothetical protein